MEIFPKELLPHQCLGLRLSQRYPCGWLVFILWQIWKIQPWSIFLAARLNFHLWSSGFKGGGPGCAYDATTVPRLALADLGLVRTLDPDSYANATHSKACPHSLASDCAIAVRGALRVSLWRCSLVLSALGVIITSTAVHPDFLIPWSPSSTDSMSTYGKRHS